MIGDDGRDPFASRHSLWNSFQNGDGDGADADAGADADDGSEGVEYEYVPRCCAAVPVCPAPLLEVAVALLSPPCSLTTMHMCVLSARSSRISFTTLMLSGT